MTVHAEALAPVDLLLPPGARLLHVGPHKTGTTSLQFAAAAQRTALRAHGVTYPGSSTDHSRPALGAMGRSIGWTAMSGQAAEPERWSELVAEIEATPDRVLVSSEMLCEATVDEIDRIVDDLGGERVHVVVTLRPLSRILPSAWQQGLKSGRHATLDDFLRHQLALGAALLDGTLDSRAQLWWRQEHGGLVQRWADKVGADRLTVVVLDPTDHGRLGSTFEELLGLPYGALGTAATSPRNRSMTAAEAETLRLANARLAEAGMKRADYGEIVRHGGVSELVGTRQPGPDEAPLTLPAWAVAPVRRMSRHAVDQIAASGVRVVGDLDALVSRDPIVRATDPARAWLPPAAAAALLTGTVAGVMGGRSWLEGRPTTPYQVRSNRPAGDVRPVGTMSSTALAKELVRRALRPLLRAGSRVMPWWDRLRTAAR